MDSPPQYLSFPEFSQNGPKQDQNEEAVPTFSSFPDLPESHLADQDKSQLREEHEKISRKRRRGEQRGSGKDREKVAEKSERKRDKERHDRARDTRRIHDQSGPYNTELREDIVRKGRDDEDEHSRHRRHHEPHKDKDRHNRERKRDRSAERRWKEDHRKKEREQAEALIRGESGPIEPSDVTRKKGEERYIERDDGIPWYESLGRESRKGHKSLETAPSQNFFVDTVGDKDSFQYGAVTSYSAPRYMRDDNQIVGFNPGLRIVYSREKTQKGIEVAPRGRPYTARYNKQVASSSHHILLKPLLNCSLDFNQEFIEFGGSNRQNKETDIPAWRSITHTVSDDDDERDIKAAIGSYTTLNQETVRKTIELEAHLHTCPTDISSWLTYSTLHLQSSARVKSHGPLGSAMTKAEAEVRLSILGKALDAAQENGHSVALHLAFLETAENVWPVGKVTRRWKNVLRQLEETDAGSEERVDIMAIWLGYIEWCQGPGFGRLKDRAEGDKEVGAVDEVVEVYVECLERLKGGIGMGLGEEAREENLIKIFMRLVMFLKQAVGYQEKALAAFQALIEINFFPPSYLSPPAKPSQAQRHEWFIWLTSDFESFWDSEAPRIGEPGAAGWVKTPKETLPPPSTEETVFKHSSNDPMEQWFEAEKHAERIYSLPGRATDLNSEIEDDPFHVVVFDDISPFLFPILLPNVRMHLIYAFMAFMGLPSWPPGLWASATEKWDAYEWTLVESDTKRMEFWPEKPNTKRLMWQTVGGEPMEPIQPASLSHPFTTPVKSWVQSRSTLFAKSGPSGWFRDMDSSDLDGKDVGFVRNVWQLLKDHVADPWFVLLGLALESAVSAKGAIKVAKSILADHRDDLCLWDGYARLEHQRGNTQTARTVYATALQAAIQTRPATGKTSHELDLWAGWAELEFDQDEHRCLEVCLMAAGAGEEKTTQLAKADYAATAPKPTTLLKARQYYTSLASPIPPSHLLLFSLYTYYTSGVESARDVCLFHADRCELSAQEASYQLLTRILYRHISRHPSPPSLYRHILEDACHKYPRNSAFLSLYMHSQVRERVSGRVARLTAAMTAGPGLLWAVWAEAKAAHRTFWDSGGDGAERVQFVLNRGISSPHGKRSAALWLLSVEFQILMGRPKIAKEVWHRALSSLGACKALYLLPFSPLLRPYFSSGELAALAALGVERGLRLRVSPPHVAEEGHVALPDDEALLDDELAFLTERQILKPY
nr:hypothetical protein L204_03383 [Cryptococcus depauperatus CBS 7855]